MKTLLSREHAAWCLYKQGIHDGSLTSRLAYFQTTHLGSGGSPLKVTGQLDEDTSWALHKPTGKAQKSNLKPKIPRGLTEDRKAILGLAIGEHAKGVKERPNGSNRSKEIDKYLPGWLRAKLLKNEYGPPWCAFFVNWVITTRFSKLPWGGYIGSCNRLVKAAQKSSKCDVFSDPEDVAPGDIFVILHGSTGHTGFVLRKNAQSTKVNTVEGNCGNRVKVGLREVKDITWFIRICPVPDRMHSPLLAATNVSAAGTR
jgi:hypothetical protein